MIIFHTLRMHRFKQFKSERTFAFRGPGLYLITGTNMLEPDLQANGTGKSTIIDALIWCITGKTVRGLRAADIVSWHTDGNASVELTFEIEKKIYTLTRRQSPNALLLKGPAKAEPVDQKTVDELIGAGFDVLVSTLVFPQFDRVFFDHDAAQQATLLSSLENLDVWQTLGQIESTRRKTLGARLDDISDHLKRLSGEADAHRKQIDDLKAQSSAFKKEQRELKATRAAAVTRLEHELAQARSDVRNATRSQKEAAAKTADVEAEVRIKEQQRADIVQQERALIQIMRTQESIMECEPPDEDDLQDSCPTCKRVYDDAKALRRAFKEMVNAHEQKTTRAREAFDEAQKQMGVLRKSKKRVDAELASLEEAVDSQVLSVAAAALATTRERVASLEGELAGVTVAEVDDDPFEALIQTARANLLAVKDQIEASKRLSSRLSVHAGDAEFWASEFPKVRFWLMDQLATEFELCVNNTLPLLGLHGWRTEISTTKVQKNGDTRAAFAPLIFAPSSPTGVPWKAWSGGETQRLRLGGHVAWKDLVRAHLGLDLNIEFYDEPTRGLSQQGCEDLMEFLQSRAALGRQIYVIDHHSQQSGFFDDIITVVKTEKGSSFE